jgi:hypothetical protein
VSSTVKVTQAEATRLGVMIRLPVPYAPPTPALVGEIVRPRFKPPAGKRGEKLVRTIMSEPRLTDVLMQLYLADKRRRQRKPLLPREELLFACAVDELCGLLRKATS